MILTEAAAELDRLLDTDGELPSTRFLLAVIAGALTDPARRWWDSTRACLAKPPPVVACGYTSDVGGFTWRCSLATHDGAHHDPAYGEFA